MDGRMDVHMDGRMDVHMWIHTRGYFSFINVQLSRGFNVKKVQPTIYFYQGSKPLLGLHLLSVFCFCEVHVQ